MKQSEFKEFFTYSKGEKRGIIFLLVIIILLAISSYIIDFIYKPDINDLDPNSKIDSFLSNLSSTTEEFQNSYTILEREEVPKKKAVESFMFDPNTITSEELIKLGFSFKQAQVFIKYREKGGKFYRPEDLKKLFVVDSLTYSRLEHLIHIDSTLFKDKNPFSGRSIANISIELNSADSSQLLNVKGIGKAYAHRIIAYREQVGGFVKLEQLKEVWGINDDLIKTVAKQLWVDSTQIKFININVISYEELKKHPYITDYQAKGIIYYRNKVGGFSSPQELIQQKLLPENKFNQIRPYLVLK